MSNDVAIRVQGVSKRFRLYGQRNQTLKQTVLTRRRGRYEELWALRDVSLEIPPASTFGIIGENGSGKSTLLKTIAGILKPDGGSVAVEGRLAALLELGAGFHPEYTGRENIYLNGALLGLSRRDVDRVFDDIVEFSELARFIDNAVKTYSSGMYARLGFSIAVHVDPDVLLVDEILAVGDESFRNRCYQRIDQMKGAGKTLVLVSHSLDTIRDQCGECAWLERGRLRALGPVDSVVRQYREAVKEQEAQSMEQSIAEIHKQIPSGRGNVGVSKVTFHSARGTGHQFRTGQNFEVRLEYHSPGPELKGVRFTVAFVREDGVVVFTTSTDTKRSTVIPGQGTVKLQLPRLPLLEGLYRVSVSMFDVKSGEPYTIMANAFPFRVSPNGTIEKGVARLDHSWVMPN